MKYDEQAPEDATPQRRTSTTRVASSASKQGGASEVPRKRLAIIDGKSVFYRGYYAMPNLTTKDGTPTGGVFGFAVMALEVIKRLQPDYVCVAWDKPKTNIRSRLKIYPAYKAGRKPPPADFYEQIPILHNLLDAFGWPLYEMDDYEADDLMGVLAVQAKQKNIETFLVTSDLDVLQLVNGHTHAYVLKTGLSHIEEFDEDGFKKKYGIDVHQFIDLKALKGDSSDNVPGVAGIGEKGALELLRDFKTLDGIYENLDLIKDSLRAKLEAGKDSAYMSKKLVTLMLDAPLKLDLKNLDVSNCDPIKVRDILQKLEFRSLLRQLPEVMQIQAEHKARNVYEHGDAGTSIVIDTKDKLNAMNLGKTSELVVYSRCAGKHGKNPQLLIISPDSKTTYVLDLVKLARESVQKALKSPLLAHCSIVGYDTKATLKVLLELDVELPPVHHDVLIGAFLLNSLRREQTLTDLAEADLGYEGSSFEDLSTDEVIGRASEITAIIRALYNCQTKDLTKSQKLSALSSKVEMPVIPVLARMEYEGIALDTKYLNVMVEQVSDSISDLEQKIYGYADKEFNIASPAQLSEVLFDKLKLPKEGIKRGKTSLSTAASKLDKLRGSHPIIDLITEFREYTKLKNTYIDTLPKMVDENSRLHTTFNLTIAQTGRLSSTDPNLQNIPVRTDLGKKIRTAFVAGAGNVLVSADYNQFELRIAAYLSGDKDLIKKFNEGVDVHLITAAEIYNRDPEDVSKQMRRDAKVVNFGVMYGLSTHGLVQATGMSYEQAKHFIDKYFELRPKLKQYIESIKKQAKRDGYVENIFGRRRPTPDIHSSNFAVREAAMRAAVNMPFQGTAADIMKMAMIAVDKMLSKQQSSVPKMLLQIHDSLIVECSESEAERTAQLLKTTMEDVVKLPIKLTVDTEVGKNWGEL